MTHAIAVSVLFATRLGGDDDCATELSTLTPAMVAALNQATIRTLLLTE